MNAKRTYACCMLIATSLVVTCAAQAYLNPSTGRWLNRDPIEERGGANQYALANNSPASKVDRLGLAFYAIDGTWTSAADESNPWWLYNQTRETPRYYWRGPRVGTTGTDTLPLAFRAADTICRDWCEAKAAGRELTINLTGWSRGAMAAAKVAAILNIEGCKCGGWLCFGGHWFRPIRVNWVGLFDAVAMMGTEDGLFPRTVPPNVAHFDHAIKTGEYWMFPTWHFTGGKERGLFSESCG